MKNFDHLGDAGVVDTRHVKILTQGYSGVVTDSLLSVGEDAVSPCYACGGHDRCAHHNDQEGKLLDGRINSRCLHFLLSDF